MFSPAAVRRLRVHRGSPHGCPLRTARMHAGAATIGLSAGRATVAAHRGAGPLAALGVGARPSLPPRRPCAAVAPDGFCVPSLPPISP